jgi:hypothetical protein
VLNANILLDLAKPHHKLVHLWRNEPGRSQPGHADVQQILLKCPLHNKLDKAEIAAGAT